MNNFLIKSNKTITKRNNKGFTLVELLSVIVILAIIMLIAIPSVLHVLTTAKRKSFVEYVDKIYLSAQKKILEEEVQGESSVGCKIYKIKSDLGLTSTGSYDGFVLIKRDGFTEDSYYITMHDDEYMIESYLYDGSLSIDNLDILSQAEEIDIDKACAMAGCTSCSVEDNQTATGICDTIQVVNDSNPGEFNGSGSKYDPYKIESIEDLVALSIGTNDGSLVADKYYRLELDLSFACDKSYADPSGTSFGDINGDGEIKSIKEELTSGLGWVPIGNNDHPFSSTILGNNKKIFGLYVNDNEEKYVYAAFIGNAKAQNNNEFISNVSFLDTNIKSNGSYNGIVMAYINFDKIKGKIDNIKTSGKLVASKGKNGSIVAYADYYSSQDITNLVNKATVDFTGGDSGGIIGTANNGKIENIYNYGQISINGGWSGGVLGTTNKGLEINNVYNYGKVISRNSSYTAAVMGYFQDGTFKNAYNYGELECHGGGYCGGVVGGSWNDREYLDLFISNIYNYGNIISYNGGKVGGCNGKLTYTHEINAYNYGNISVSGNNYADIGGVVGNVNGGALLYNAGNHGNVSCSINADHVRIGGVVGYGEGTISNVYNVGNLVSNREGTGDYLEIGGLIGNGSCKNCYSIGDIKLSGNINGSNDYIGLAFGSPNTNNLGNVYSVGSIKSSLVKESWNYSHYGALMGYFTSSYYESTVNYYVKAVITGIPKVGLAGDYVGSWTDKVDNVYIDLYSDAEELTDTIYGDEIDIKNGYYASYGSSPNNPGLKHATQYDFSQVNGMWFRDTLKLGNNYKYANGLYPKLYKLLPNGSVSSELVEGQKDIPIK